MKYKREDLIDSIIKMRIEKGASTKTIVEDFLQKQLGYKQSYAYTLLKEAREKITEIYKNDNTNAINEAVGQLEELYESAIKEKNKKLALEIRKEINRNTGQQAYDNSAIYIYTTAHKNVTPSIRTGQYTEQVFDFIMQHMYGYEKAANPFDETTPNPKQTNWGSGVLGH
jgi:N-methylhydantoinase A/oxoprolinase/acetone carboxylase beta subunit